MLPASDSVRASMTKSTGALPDRYRPSVMPFRSSTRVRRTSQLTRIVSVIVVHLCLESVISASVQDPNGSKAGRLPTFAMELEAVFEAAFEAAVVVTYVPLLADLCICFSIAAICLPLLVALALTIWGFISSTSLL